MNNDEAAIMQALLDNPDNKASAINLLDRHNKANRRKDIKALVDTAIEEKLLSFIPTEQPKDWDRDALSWDARRRSCVWHQMEYLTWCVARDYQDESGKIRIIERGYNPQQKPPKLMGLLYNREQEIFPALIEAITKVLEENK